MAEKQIIWHRFIAWYKKAYCKVLKKCTEKHPLVPVISLNGVIGAVMPGRSGLSLSSTLQILEKAFAMRGVEAIALAINSPGGSPVQSSLIYRRIKVLSEKYEVPVYSFAEDVAASGGYMLACAGDEIYADACSIVGSIGVVSSGFGFNKAIEKIGVERRVYTAGDNKSMLDPFKPEKPADIKRLKEMQLDVHEEFKKLVRDSRGSKLNGEDKQIFNGEFWSGNKALEFGLIDGIGDVHGIMREKFGDNVKIKFIDNNRGFFRRKFNLALGVGDKQVISGLTEEFIGAVESRAVWSRFGL